MNDRDYFFPIEAVIPITPNARKKLPHSLKCRETRFINKLKSLSGVSEELLGKAEEKLVSKKKKEKELDKFSA